MALLGAQTEQLLTLREHTVVPGVPYLQPVLGKRPFHQTFFISRENRCLMAV